MLMELRIDKKKLMFFHHLFNLPDKALAKEIAVTQIRFNFPGFMTECQELMVKYNLPDVRNHTKLQWNKIVEKTINLHNKNILLMKIKNYKKLDHLALEKEEFKTKLYLTTLNLADARLKFALRTKMARTVQTNFKGDPSYKSNEWKCNVCQVLDTQEHIMWCPAYSSLRNGKDLKKDKDLVDYFRKVISIRNKDN